MSGVPQKTVNNLLSGRTKSLKMDIVMKLQNALGIVSDTGAAYGAKIIRVTLSPDQERWIAMLEEYPAARESFEALTQLDETDQKIHLGEILKDVRNKKRGE